MARVPAQSQDGYRPTRVWKGIDLDRVPLRQKDAHYIWGSSGRVSGPVTPAPADPHDKQQYAKSEDLQEKGWALLQYNRAAEAVPYLEGAISAWPASPASYRALAEAYMETGNTDAAIMTLRHLYYGWSGRDWSKGVAGWGEEGQRLGSSVETDVTLLMQFAILLEQTGQDKEALSVYQHAYGLLPTDRGPLPPNLDGQDYTKPQLEAATRVGFALVDGDQTDALSQLQQAVSLQPNLAAAYYYEGNILKEKTGQSVDALEAFSKARLYGGPQMKPYLSKAYETGPPEFKSVAEKAAP